MARSGWKPIRGKTHVLSFEVLSQRKMVTEADFLKKHKISDKINIKRLGFVEVSKNKEKRREGKRKEEKRKNGTAVRGWFLKSRKAQNQIPPPGRRF